MQNERTNTHLPGDLYLHIQNPDGDHFPPYFIHNLFYHEIEHLCDILIFKNIDSRNHRGKEVAIFLNPCNTLMKSVVSAHDLTDF
jgi:hypothetical protein